MEIALNLAEKISEYWFKYDICHKTAVLTISTRQGMMEEFNCRP